MGTKNNPGKFDCYANAHPDEPMFILLGRDRVAAQTVRDWCEYRIRVGKNRAGDDMLAEALTCADAMDAWRERKTEPVTPEEAGATVPKCPPHQWVWREAHDTHTCSHCGMYEADEPREPAEPSEPPGCEVYSFSSRMCERGTKGCIEPHGREPEPPGEPQEAGAEDRTEPPPGGVFIVERFGDAWDVLFNGFRGDDASYEFATREKAVAACWAHYDAHPAVAQFADAKRERDRLSACIDHREAEWQSAVAEADYLRAQLAEAKCERDAALSAYAIVCAAALPGLPVVGAEAMALSIKLDRAKLRTALRIEANERRQDGREYDADIIDDALRAADRDGVICADNDRVDATDLRAQLSTVTRELANERERTSLYAEQRDRARAEGLGLMQERDEARAQRDDHVLDLAEATLQIQDLFQRVARLEKERDEAREHAARWKAAADADSRRLDALEAELAVAKLERDDARAEGERLGVAKERAVVVPWLRKEALRCRGFATRIGDDFASALTTAADSIERGDHHPKHSTALSDYVRAAQAEALEALLELGCGACGVLMSECGMCKDIRERAASLRKGGDNA